MALSRTISQVLKGTAQQYGGVDLWRTIGTKQLDYFDPFLVLEVFHSENPDAGFRDHPHRGLEVTFTLFV